MNSQLKVLALFIRYNLVALMATAVDFSLFALLVEVLGLWYVASAVISAVTGGVVAFLFNRSWVFMSKNGKLTQQAVRYLTVWVSSIILNTGGLYLFVSSTGLNTLYSKIIVSVVVGIGFNFLMNKYYVFE